MEKKLTLLTIDLPDYFRGYPEPVMQIPVWKEMTKAELIDAIVDEYNMVYDYLEFEPKWRNITDTELREMCDVFINAGSPFERINIATLEEMQSEDCDQDFTCVFICIEEL